MMTGGGIREPLRKALQLAQQQDATFARVALPWGQMQNAAATALRRYAAMAACSTADGRPHALHVASLRSIATTMDA